MNDDEMIFDDRECLAKFWLGVTKGGEVLAHGNRNLEFPYHLARCYADEQMPVKCYTRREVLEHCRAWNKLVRKTKGNYKFNSVHPKQVRLILEGV